VARDSQIDESRISELLEGVRRWRGKPLDVVQRVDLRAAEVVLHVDLSEMLGEEGTLLRYAIPACVKRRGVEMRLVLHGEEKGAGDARVDPALVKAIVRGRQWFEQLASGQAKSFVAIAKAEGMSERYVAHLIPLAFLAPDIVARILSGTQPVDLTTEVLTKRTDLPLAWAEQRELLGFD
jgi:hypothetical protein